MAPENNDRRDPVKENEYSNPEAQAIFEAALAEVDKKLDDLPKPLTREMAQELQMRAMQETFVQVQNMFMNGQREVQLIDYIDENDTEYTKTARVAAALAAMNNAALVVTAITNRVLEAEQST